MSVVKLRLKKISFIKVLQLAMITHDTSLASDISFLVEIHD